MDKKEKGPSISDKAEFKPGEKSVKFEAYYGKRDTQKALAFIKQFDAAFGGENFSEISKIRMVRMHLKDAAINWWLKVIKEGKEPTTWAEFKVMFNKKFLPSTF